MLLKLLKPPFGILAEILLIVSHRKCEKKNILVKVEMTISHVRMSVKASQTCKVITHEGIGTL